MPGDSDGPRDHEWTKVAVTQMMMGLDGSAHDHVIADWVARFTSNHAGDHVIGVHVVPRTILWMIAGAQADSNRYVQAVRSRIQHQVMTPLSSMGVSNELRVAIGDPARQLAVLAYSTGADLIVIGGPDHGTLHDVVLGDTARRLERRADVPVVVVPLSTHHAHARR